jgi:hypothetical protein
VAPENAIVSNSELFAQRERDCVRRGVRVWLLNAQFLEDAHSFEDRRSRFYPDSCECAQLYLLVVLETWSLQPFCL